LLADGVSQLGWPSMRLPGPRMLSSEGALGITGRSNQVPAHPSRERPPHWPSDAEIPLARDYPRQRWAALALAIRGGCDCREVTLQVRWACRSLSRYPRGSLNTLFPAHAKNFSLMFLKNGCSGIGKLHETTLPISRVINNHLTIYDNICVRDAADVARGAESPHQKKLHTLLTIIKIVFNILHVG